MRFIQALICVATVSLALGASAQQQPAPSIEAFTAAPSMRSVSMSPNGNYVAFLRDTAETDTIMVVDLASNTMRGIQSVRPPAGEFMWVRWKSDDRLLFGLRQETTVRSRDRTGSRTQDVGGFDFTRYRVFTITREGTSPVEMFGEQTQTLQYGLGSTFLVDSLPSDAGHVLLTATDNAGVGVWKADINTGRVERIANGEFETFNYFTDGTGYPVVRMDALRSGAGYRILRRANGERNWTNHLEVRRAAGTSQSPDFEVVGSGPGPNQVYALARAENADLRGLYVLDTATGQLSAPLQQGREADAYYPWINPDTRQVFAQCEYAARLHCSSPESGVERHLRAVEQFLGADVTAMPVSFSSDGNVWLLYAEGPQEPGAYYIYNRSNANMRPLAEVYPNAPRDGLAPTQVVQYQGRDGAGLWAYVTALPGQGPRAMVVMPHGGPEARDTFGYDAYAQFLASRGYVVVQPNFRGSDGFGRAFADAGRGQWGLRMQDDVTDAVQHMIQSGVADPQRICIVGASYGGYAALAGVTLTPDLYRCAISIAGVSDLIDVLRTERLDNGRQSLSYGYWLRSIGDPSANRDALIAASPARLADRVRVPVLLVHGSEDDTVSYQQSQTMQRALERAGKPARLVRIEDGGHSYYGWTDEQRVTLFRESEAFLAQNLAPR